MSTCAVKRVLRVEEVDLSVARAVQGVSARGIVSSRCWCSAART